MPMNARGSWVLGQRVALSVAMAAGLVLSACGSSGSSSSTTTKPVVSAPAKNEPGPNIATLGYRLEWRGYPQVAADGQVHFIDFANDAVVIQDDRNVVTLMENSTGRNRWSVNGGAAIAKFVGNAFHNNNLLVCSENDIQFLDLKTGQLHDRQSLAVITNTEPALVGDMAIFGCATGEVLGHNLRSGYKQWGHKIQGRITGKPALIDGLVAVLSDAGELVILDPVTGESSGRRQKIFSGIDNSLAVGDGRVYVASRDQSVWAFNAIDGRRVWRYRTESSLRDQPTYHDSNLYQAVPGKGLMCFEASTGDVKWTASGITGSVVGVRGGRLLAWTGSELLTLDAARGDVVARVAMPGVATVKTDAFVDGNVYTVSRLGGRVEKFSPRN